MGYTNEVYTDILCSEYENTLLIRVDQARCKGCVLRDKASGGCAKSFTYPSTVTCDTFKKNREEKAEDFEAGWKLLKRRS